MRHITIIAFCVFLSSSLFSQNITDAVRYSVYDVGGTARTVAIGGAIGALGADFSVLSTNPAGLAAYRRSELVFTPTLVISTVESELEGPQNQVIEREKTTFNFNNIGIVIANRPRQSKWTTGNFGLGLNRVANFHQEIRYEGISPGSVTDRFLENAFGKSLDELYAFEEGLAYDAFAIYDDADGNYFSDFAFGEEVEKNQLIRRKGSINELAISLAGNYDEKLLIGATIGVPFLNFEEAKTYMETDLDDSNPVFDELIFIEQLTTSGVGINLKLGLIYRMNQMLRVGAAVHTPTAFALEDTWSNRMTYEFTDPDVSSPGEIQSPNGVFEYKYKTPWRYIGSVGVIIQKYGFLSAEVEWLDYGKAKFDYDTDNADDLAAERELNAQIGNELGGGLNVRLGGEYVYEKLRFRAGYALSQSPYGNEDRMDNFLSLGMGVRGKNAFVDFAYKRILNEEDYIPFVTNDKSLESLVKTEDLRNKFMLTLGFKF